MTQAAVWGAMPLRIARGPALSNRPATTMLTAVASATGLAIVPPMISQPSPILAFTTPPVSNTTVMPFTSRFAQKTAASTAVISNQAVSAKPAFTVVWQTLLVVDPTTTLRLMTPTSKHAHEILHSSSSTLGRRLSHSWLPRTDFCHDSQHHNNRLHRYTSDGFVKRRNALCSGGFGC